MKFQPTLLALAAFCCIGSAQAEIVTFSGNDNDGRRFNRPVEDMSELSAIGTNVPYDVFEFTVSAPGIYSFLTTGFEPRAREFGDFRDSKDFGDFRDFRDFRDFDASDTMTFLYGDSFNPDSPLTNLLMSNDDLVTFTTSGFAYDLDAGSRYVYVITGFENTFFNRHSTTIGGPGVISAVPEPDAWMMMGFGLAALGLVSRRRANARKNLLA